MESSESVEERMAGDDLNEESYLFDCGEACSTFAIVPAESLVGEFLVFW